MATGKLCPYCGYSLRSQRTGPCPNCDRSPSYKRKKDYPISAEELDLFQKLDQNGGVLDLKNWEVLKPKQKRLGKGVELGALSNNGKAVTMKVLGVNHLFTWVNGRITIIHSFKDGASQFDAANYQLPGAAMNNAYAVAVSVLKKEQQKREGKFFKKRF